MPGRRPRAEETAPTWWWPSVTAYRLLGCAGGVVVVRRLPRLSYETRSEDGYSSPRCSFVLLVHGSPAVGGWTGGGVGWGKPWPTAAATMSTTLRVVSFMKATSKCFPSSLTFLSQVKTQNFSLRSGGALALYPS
jgi:hypothetical protein